MKPDAITERLVPDPSHVPDVRVVAGFLGNTTREGYWRLYLTADLTTYIEFRQEDVVHSEQLKPEDSPLGGTVVWIKRDANVRRIRTTSREAQADFLQGAIKAHLKRRTPPTGMRPPLVAQVLPFSPSFHFWSICDELAAPSFLGGGDVFCGGSFECFPTWEAEC
jgi:hypothetical protein